MLLIEQFATTQFQCSGIGKRQEALIIASTFRLHYSLAREPKAQHGAWGTSLMWLLGSYMT